MTRPWESSTSLPRPSLATFDSSVSASRQPQRVVHTRVPRGSAASQRSPVRAAPRTILSQWERACFYRRGHLRGRHLGLFALNSSKRYQSAAARRKDSWVSHAIACCLDRDVTKAGVEISKGARGRRHGLRPNLAGERPVHPLQAYQSNEPLTLDADGYAKDFKGWKPAQFGVSGTFNVQDVNTRFLQSTRLP